jgi:predicted Zn-dependent peptidase
MPRPRCRLPRHFHAAQFVLLVVVARGALWALFKSLCPLLATRFLCFQRIAAYFCKTPGGGYQHKVGWIRKSLRPAHDSTKPMKTEGLQHPVGGHRLSKKRESPAPCHTLQFFMLLIHPVDFPFHRACVTILFMSPETRDIQKHALPNGLVAITETMPHVRSVSVGVWIRSGSRREVHEENGLAHFIEHMVFKGTERRSAESIAREMDSIGGMLDAFTSKEQICFNAKILDEHLPIAFDVIADLVLRPKFDSEDVKKERQVVLEEIKMDLDNPEYLLHEIFTRGFWPGHALGRPILGTPETVGRFHRDALRARFADWFAPDQLVITAAGNVTHQQVLELVQREFGHLKPLGPRDPHFAPQTGAPIHLETKRDLEQVHLCVGVPSVPLGHQDRFAVAVLNNLLGGGMSSRLFQNIREKQGLAYAVFSEITPYSDAGMLTVYAGTAKENIGQVIDLIVKEFSDLKNSPVPEEELLRSKNHLKGSLMLSLESTSSRMSNLARQELYFARFYTLDEILASIEAVTREELQALANQYFRPELIAVTVLGPLNGFTLDRSRLAC